MGGKDGLEAATISDIFHLLGQGKFREFLKLGPVVQSVDNTIHRINHYAIHWIAIYPVDSVIHPSNNPALVYSFMNYPPFEQLGPDVWGNHD